MKGISINTIDSGSVNAFIKKPGYCIASGTANAIQLVATAGGIDLSTGSGTADIDILSGDAINLKAGSNGITLSTATFTLGSGFSLSGTTGLSAFGSTATAGTANGAGDVYIERDLEVDGTIYGNLVGSIDLDFTQGSVLFIDSSGAIAQDNANFFWEDGTNELGLGDATPDDRLDVEDINLGYNFLFGSSGVTFSTANTTGINIDTYGSASITSNQGAGNAIELIATAGGIDLSTGSSTGDIDILSGDAINLSSVGGNITLSTPYNAGAGTDIVLQSGDQITLKAINGDISLSAGSPSGQSDARDQITQALLGLTLLLGAYIVLNTVNPSLTSFNLPQLKEIEVPANTSGAAQNPEVLKNGIMVLMHMNSGRSPGPEKSVTALYSM